MKVTIETYRMPGSPTSFGARYWCADQGRHYRRDWCDSRLRAARLLLRECIEPRGRIENFKVIHIDGMR